MRNRDIYSVDVCVEQNMNRYNNTCMSRHDIEVSISGAPQGVLHST